MMDIPGDGIRSPRFAGRTLEPVNHRIPGPPDPSAPRLQLLQSRCKARDIEWLVVR